MTRPGRLVRFAAKTVALAVIVPIALAIIVSALMYSSLVETVAMARDKFRTIWRDYA